MKQLTKEQVKILSAYEQHFETAVKSSWSRYPGVVALQEIHRIMQDVTGTKIPLNTNCQSCVLKLLQDCGRLYFQYDRWVYHKIVSGVIFAKSVDDVSEYGEY